MRVVLMLMAVLAVVMPAVAQQVEVTSVTRLEVVDDVTAAPDGTVWVQGKRIHAIVDGVERVFSPVDARIGYLWPSLSPDGRRIAFFAPGKGIVVIDLRGQVLAMVGDYEMPCWLDDEHLVAQDAAYDGMTMTRSRLVLLRADGSWMTHLTPPDQQASAPACRDSRIIYTDAAGDRYMMTVNILE
ncbi:MAG: hypothetical protein IJV05_06630 [Muribaculaceae bacterium]|nr:hypothetical protein [Muribaculaceae bacterium]